MTVVFLIGLQHLWECRECRECFDMLKEDGKTPVTTHASLSTKVNHKQDTGYRIPEISGNYYKKKKSCLGLDPLHIFPQEYKNWNNVGELPQNQKFRAERWGGITRFCYSSTTVSDVFLAKSQEVVISWIDFLKSRLIEFQHG